MCYTFKISVIFDEKQKEKSICVVRTGCNLHQNIVMIQAFSLEPYVSHQIYITKQRSYTRMKKQMCMFRACMCLHVYLWVYKQSFFQTNYNLLSK